jgi:porphobilinogen synthase
MQGGEMYYPIYRPRRMRKNEILRSMIRETFLNKNDFVYPLFVCPGKQVKNEVNSMPGIYQFSIDNILKEVEESVTLGIKSFILFGIPETKDELGTEAYHKHGIIQKCIRELKKKFSDIIVITDVCLCEYTSHGHCGIVKNGEIVNDETLELLGKEALSHAEAGADMIAPSDMMDGRVGYIRETLDENGFENIPIMAYSAKYSSAYYGPFRDAAESPPQFGDRKSYQMDIANSQEALREVELDIDEGADIVMVKPALAYLDIIYKVKDNFNRPVAAYNVSGEYSMIKAAGKLGWIDETQVMYETLLSIKRAGADIILTYFAKDIAKIL